MFQVKENCESYNKGACFESPRKSQDKKSHVQILFDILCMAD